MTSDLGAFGRPRTRLTGVFARYRFAVAAFDQVALSVFAFALNICLLRALSATDYGTLSLWLTIALFAVSIQAALVTGPLNIYLPGAKDKATAHALGAAIATVNLLAVLS